MTLTVTISGTPVTVQVDTLAVDDAIEKRTTANFTVVDRDCAAHYNRGMPVVITSDNGVEFSGRIDTVTEKSVITADGTATIFHEISCADWHSITDNRIVAAAYENTRADLIVADLVTTYLSAEGITYHGVEAPMVTEAIFNYVSLREALDTLAEKSGFTWYVDFYKVLHFVPPTAVPCTVPLTQADILEGSMTVENGNPKYRNKQYVKGGREITDLQTEKFKGDGAQRSFALAFPVATVPTVTINGNKTLPTGEYVRNLPELCGADSEFTTTTGWTCSNAWLSNGTIILQSPDGSTVAQCYLTADNTKVPANQTWQMAINARYTSTTGTPNALIVDFYAIGYDAAEQELFIPNLVVGDYITFTKTFNTQSPPTSFQFRIFTFSTRPIQVDWVACYPVNTVGIKGVDTGKSWYWSKGDNVITQDASGTPLGTSDTLTVQYRGMYEVVAAITDQDQVEQRKKVEGGTGLVEDVVEVPMETSASSANETAVAKLRKYGTMGRRVKLRTTNPTFESGMYVHVIIPRHGLDTGMLVESGSYQPCLLADGSIRHEYSLTLTEGAVSGGWERVFAEMARKPAAFSIRQNISEKAVLSVLTNLSPEMWGWQETVTCKVNVCILANTVDTAGLDKYCC